MDAAFAIAGDRVIASQEAWTGLYRLDIYLRPPERVSGQCEQSDE